MNPIHYFSIHEVGSKVLPQHLHLSDFEKEFGKVKMNGKDVAIDSLPELKQDGKHVVKYTFALGSTGKADISDLLRNDIMNQLDVAYRPASKMDQLPVLATILQTNQETQNFGALLGGNESLNEWLGPRKSNKFVGMKNTAVTQTWERTYRFERKALEDDKSGLLSIRIAGYVSNIQAAMLRRIVDYYIGMATRVHWQSGQFVVDTDHTWVPQGGDSTAQSNKSTSTPIPPNLTDAFQNMQLFKDWNGNDIENNVPTALLIGPKYDAAVDEAFGAPLYFGSSQPTTAGDVGQRGTGKNYLYQKIAPENRVIHGRLAGTYDDYAFLISGMIKPVILVERSDVPDEFVIKDNPETSDEVFEQDQISVGYRRRDTIIDGSWQNVFGFIS